MPIIVPDPGRFSDEPAHLAWHAALREAHPELSLPEVTSRDQNHLDAHAILAATVNQWGEFPHLIPASPTNSTLLHDVAHRGAHTWSNAQEEPAEITHGSQVPTSPLVGLPDGWEPKQTVGGFYSGMSNGQVLEDLQINGDVFVTSDGSVSGTPRTGVEIRRCRIMGRIWCGYSGGNPDNVLIENCEIDGGGSTTDGFIGPGAYTAVRTVMHNGQRGVVADVNVRLTECWIYDTFLIEPDAHRSIIGTGYDGPHFNVEVRRCYLDGNPPAGKSGEGLSAIVVTYDDEGAVGDGAEDWVLEDCHVVCGTTLQVLILSKSGTDTLTNMTFTGNVFDRDVYEFGGFYGFGTAAPATASTWSGNVWGARANGGWSAPGTAIPPIWS